MRQNICNKVHIRNIYALCCIVKGFIFFESNSSHMALSHAILAVSSILKLLDEQRLLHKEALQTYQSIAAEYFSSPEKLSNAAHFQYLTLRNGMHHEQGWLS